MPIEQVETESFAIQANMPKELTALRVVSWNVARGAQLDAIIEFLVANGADLILLQETDRNAHRTGYRNVAEDIARKLGMNYVFGVEFEELGQGLGGVPAYHGQTNLSRWPLLDSRILRFNEQSRFWHPFWWTPRLPFLQRRLGGRMALVSHVSVGTTTLAAYNVHLESRNGDWLRRSQLGEILEDSCRYGPETPVILAGDFNFDFRQNSVVSVLEGMRFENPLRDASAGTTRFRRIGRSSAIDWILTRGAIVRGSAKVHSSVQASDHYPLSIALQVS